MSNYATITDYDKIAVIVFSGENHVGSGCLLWSEGKKQLYCITAKHCISDNISLKTYADGGLYSLNIIDDVICNKTDDIAIYKIVVDEYTKGIPYTLTSNLLTPPRKVAINGFPKINNTIRSDISAEYNSVTNNIINLSVQSLDAYTVNRLDEVEGISGSGCYEVIDNFVKFIGVENKAINDDVTYKNLYAIALDAINIILTESKLPLLPNPTPSYITERIGNYQTISQSLAKQSYRNRWVDLTISENIRKSVIEHFKDEPLVLFLCGQSGIGKTRGVLNTCNVTKYKFSIFYETVQNFKQDKSTLINYALKYHEKLNIIIDEATLDDYNEINDCFGVYKQYFKFILIGTMAKKQSNRIKNLKYLKQIGEDDIKNVLKEEYSSFSDEELNDIYKLAHNDLRLAILISRLYAKEKESESDFTMPILKGCSSKLIDEYSSADRILKKTIYQYEGTRPEEINIKQYFNRLSLFVDIGYTNSVEGEINALANFFQEKDASKFKSAIRYLLDINLGIEKLNYFEPSPRALSKLAFEQQGWDLIRDKLDDFMESIPNDLMRKRFFDRVDECEMAKEVNEALASWFRNKYYMAAIQNINHFNANKIMMYIEHSPVIGLAWLKEGILNASSDQIKQFHWWNGRRNVVWTCEHLAHSKEWFFDCEEILYKLAQNENETGITNNSQGTWSEMFSLMLSNTEVSYYKRFDVLIRRALQCNSESEYAMFNSAFSNALNLSGGFTISPPKMIGGVITPENWEPETLEEIIGILRLYLNKVTQNFDSFSTIMKNCVVDVLSRHISNFLSFELFEDFKKSTNKLFINQKQKDEFILKLEFQLKIMDSASESLIEKINCWIEELKDTTLQGKISNYLTRNVYSYGYEDASKSRWEKELCSLADELYKSDIKQEILMNITDKKEFDNEAMSKLAEGISTIDNLSLIEFVVYLLNSKLCDTFVIGYFIGVYKKQGGLPNCLLNLLDKFKESASNIVLRLTTITDISDKGFRRIIGLLDTCDNIAFVQNMRYKEWFTFLVKKQKVEFLEALSNCENYLRYVLCFEIIRGWILQGDNFDELYHVAITILKKCFKINGKFEIYAIVESFKKFPNGYYSEIVELMISKLDFNELYSDINYINYIIEFIDSTMNDVNERQIMYCLGKKLLDSEGTIKGPAMTGFLDRFSIDVVLDWIENDPQKRAPLVSYHLLAPTLNNKSISTLTKEVLSKYDNETVYKAFIYGGYNYKVYTPKDYYDKKEQWFELLAKCEKSDIHLIRRWSIYEKQRIESICKEYEEYMAQQLRYE